MFTGVNEPMPKKSVAGFLIIALIVLLMPSIPQAADPAVATGTIRGTLLDSNGQALVGYKVKVVDSAGVVHEAAPTGPDGKYEIPDLPPGQYTYQIIDPAGKVVPVKIPPVNLQAGTAVSQPIAIVPKGGSSGKGPLIAWLVGGGAVVAAVAIAASNNDDDDDDDDDDSMTPSGP